MLTEMELIRMEVFILLEEQCMWMEQLMERIVPMIAEWDMSEGNPPELPASEQMKNGNVMEQKKE